VKLTNEVYLVGGGDHGIRLTHRSDCAVYLIDGGENHLALIDSGVGADTAAIVRNIEEHGFDPKHIEVLYLTHYHTDHIGGARDWRDMFGCKVAISAEEAPFVENADEEKLGLRVAKDAGYYPKDFVVKPCPIDLKLGDDQELTVGQLKMRTLISPGHTLAHVCYVLQGKEKRYLFAGDHITYGGLISLQNYENSGSSIDGYRNSAHKFVGLNIDAFLPSHMLFTLNRGQTEVDLMIAACKNLFFNGRFYAPMRIF
jgi:glyoxylase-like metal-dependent hydrolase (beta-lactamase superfamily II)